MARTSTVPESASSNSLEPEHQIEDSGSESDDDIRETFAAVLASIRRDQIPNFCLSVRAKLEEFEGGQTKKLAVPDVAEPLFGSTHALFPIEFDDGIKWMLKIPAHGTRDAFDEPASRSLTTEALTMKFLGRKTSIPIPKVLAYDASLDNSLNCPYILTNFVSGVPLYECWFDKTGDNVMEHRKQALKDIATAMAQLDQFSFKAGGSLIFDENENPARIGPTRCLDRRAQLDKLFADEEVDETCYFDAGPFEDPHSYYTHALVRQEIPNNDIMKGEQRLLSLFLDWFPEPKDSRQEFVLAHPDCDIQNFIVSQDGHLQAIIDWDGVEAVPRSLGYESYPGWLTRDWDPAMYGWDEDMERGIEPKGVWEDSPSTLAHHRAEYEQFMRSALFEKNNREDDEQTSRPSRTAHSLYLENLFIATLNPVCTFPILEKFVEEINKTFDNRDLAELVEELNKLFDDDHDELDVYDLLSALGGGSLGFHHTEILKRGFLSLFKPR